MESTESTATSTGDEVRRGSSHAVGWKLVVVGILLQVVLLWDVFAMSFIDVLVSVSVDANGYPQDATVMALNRAVVVGIWTLSVAVVYYWSRKRDLLQQLFTWRDAENVLVASVAAITLHVLDNVVMAAVANEALGPQALREHAFFVGLYGSIGGSLVFLLQALYYLFEALIVIFMIGLFQRTGEKWFDRQTVPWGGIGLTLTWGILHFLLSPTVEVLVLPLAMGAVYVLGDKHVVPVFLAVILVFLV